MKLNALLAVQVLASLTTAFPIAEPETANKACYDVIIVGGGPAGLAAASALGRVNRDVLLVDSGDYRNNVTRHIHDVLGYDGATTYSFGQE